MKSKTRLFVVIFLVILLLVMAIIILSSLQSKGSPEIVVYSPATGDQVGLQTPVLVHAVAADEAGIDSLELWVDGNLVALEQSTLPKGGSPLPLVEYWEAMDPGEHVFILRATTHDGRRGTTSITISVSELSLAASRTYTVQDGDTLAGIAAEYNLDVAELIAANPGLGEELVPGSSLVIPPGEDDGIGRPESSPPEFDASPPEAEVMRARPGIEWIAEALLADRIGLTLGTPIRFERLYLEVDKDYRGVFCYASIDGGPFTRVPAAGFLTNTGVRTWSLDAADLPTGMIPTDRPGINVKMQCLGFNDSPAGGMIYDLGTMDLNHLRDEWDGRQFSYETSGSGGSSTVTYGLKGGGDGELGPELLLFGHCAEDLLPGRDDTVCVLDWYFTGSATPDWVEGYHIYRNGALYQTILDPGAHQYFLYDNAREVPFCGTEDEFHIVAAYAGEIIPAWIPRRSNTLTLSDPLCRNRARTALVYLFDLMPTCLRAETIDIGLNTWGMGEEGILNESDVIWGDVCEDPSSPDDWPSTYGGCDAYGTMAINRVPVMGWCGSFNSGQLNRLIGYRGEAFTIFLDPEEDLVMNLNIQDQDLSSGDDELCHGSVSITSDELDGIPGEMGEQRDYVAGFNGAYGYCLLRFSLIVIPPEISDQPPPPIVVP